MTSRIEYLQTNQKSLEAEKPISYPLALRFVQFGFRTLGRIFPRKAAKIAYRLFATPRKRAKHKVSDPILEKARLFEVLFGKQILKAYEWGRGDRIILLVHGWESRGTALRTFAPDLVKAGYRVVTFDGPAHGETSGKRTNMIHFSKAVQAMINHLGEVEHIITHSFGGGATLLGLSQLERPIGLKKLVLVAPPYYMNHLFSGTVKTLGLPKNVARHFKAYLEQRIRRPLESLDVPITGKQVNAEQILLVHDKKDPIISFKATEDVLEQWDQPRLLVTEGFGHYQLMKNPDLIQRVSQFILEE